MKYYIVDTHALIWRLLQSKKLSLKANKAFTEGIEGKTLLIIPAIVLLEVMSVLEKYEIENRFLEILDDIERTPMYEICSLNIEVLRATAKINDIEELHDKVIVAIARMKNAAIITKDRIIRKLYSKTIWQVFFLYILKILLNGKIVGVVGAFQHHKTRIKHKAEDKPRPYIYAG